MHMYKSLPGSGYVAFRVSELKVWGVWNVKTLKP